MDHKCQLCGENDFNLLHNRGRGKVEVHNYICHNCGFTFVLPRPALDKHEKQYKEGGFSKEARGSTVPGEEKFKHSESLAYKRYKILESVVQGDLYDAINPQMLEIGCGTGSFLRYMKAAGWMVHGLEPDNVFAKTGSERYKVPIQSVFLEEFESETLYDMVATFHVIEHVEDVNFFLKKIHSLIKEDGLLYIECPSIDHMYGADKDFFFWDVHINTFSDKTLVSFLIKNGFEIINQSTFNKFTNVICRKKPVSVDHKKYYDNYKRIERLVDNYSVKPKQKGSLLKRLAGKSKRKVKTLLEKKITKRDSGNGVGSNRLRVAHLGFHHSTNTGDILLFEVLRDLLHYKKNNLVFELIDLHQKVTESLISHLNSFDAIVIGGGGLFLKDTNPNNISGWQWACPNDLMQKIDKPIIVFAVGYNRFRGQDDFHSNFTENINILLTKSIFFGIRNNGSIAKINQYIDADKQDKITYQPCATTLISKFERNIGLGNEINKVLAVNIAFDRHHLRFQGRENEILWSIADALKELEAEGWRIVLLVHVVNDIEAQIWFKSRGVSFEVVNLVGSEKSKIYAAYEKFSVVMGMRGHAQMIPFGLNIPIITLSTHDKMMYFLEDIKHPEWGIELVSSDNLTGEVIQKVSHIDENYQKIKLQIEDAQDTLWKKTEQNLEFIFQNLKANTNEIPKKL